MVGLFVLTGVPTLLADQLSPSGIWLWNTVTQDQLWLQTETHNISLIQLSSDISTPKVWHKQRVKKKSFKYFEAPLTFIYLIELKMGLFSRLSN